MGKRLLLYCETTHSTYTLAEEGTAHREVFVDLRDALAYASRFVYEETAVLVFNEMGKLVVESTITPRGEPNPADVLRGPASDASLPAAFIEAQGTPLHPEQV